MSAGQYNFTIEQGATLRKKFRWTDPDGTPINLTGAICRLQIRKTKSTTSPLIADLTQHLALDAPDGSVTLEVPGEVTYDVKFDTGDTACVSTAGDQKRLVEGVVTTSRETNRECLRLSPSPLKRIRLSSLKEAA
ncbi:hypothetical protein DFR67_114159 [Williamsia limnetica]|uniref:Uncharacterized protein n=1 Tax=Williamsia limnetica TaxID=882452 RepID=A0A318RDZ5_WILLI|nr:hypothetical protein [Williamsia limnetica]PYE14060.1 hypothetical protein DFR67_114159 [Williamsia limnetica]